MARSLAKWAFVAAVSIASTISCSSASSPASEASTSGPINLNSVDPCIILDSAILQSASLTQVGKAHVQGMDATCKYEMPSGVDTLIVLNPDTRLPRATIKPSEPGDTVERHDLAVAGFQAIEVRRRTAQGGHTSCLVATDFGQGQLAAVVDDDLGGKDASIDSMCEHVRPLAEYVFKKLAA